MKNFDDLTDFEVYACDSPVVVKAAAKSCLENGLGKEGFFSDAFEYAFASKIITSKENHLKTRLEVV